MTYPTNASAQTKTAWVLLVLMRHGSRSSSSSSSSSSRDEVGDTKPKTSPASKVLVLLPAGRPGRDEMSEPSRIQLPKGLRRTVPTSLELLKDVRDICLR